MLFCRKEEGDATMTKKQLSLLFLCNLAGYIIGSGLLPLLPVYAVRLGASRAQTGYFLSFSYLTLALGTLSAGWLSEKTGRRKFLLIIAGASGMPILWLIAQTTDLWLYVFLTGILWFFGGLGLTLVSILAGLFAEKSKRGKVFGLLALTNGLGTVIGGTLSGTLVEWFGYSQMYFIFSFVLLSWIVAGPFLKDKVPEKRVSLEASLARKNRVQLPGPFYLLFMGSVLVSTAHFSGLLGRSLEMNGQGFSAAEISSTAVVGGLISIPFTLISGWLSDRAGRTPFLAGFYLVGTGGLLVLATATELWHFWVAITLLLVMVSVNTAVGSALTTDLVSEESRSKGISLFNATMWLGGIIGFGSSGYLIQQFGKLFTFLLLAGLPVIAVALLRQVHLSSARNVKMDFQKRNPISKISKSG